MNFVAERRKKLAEAGQEPLSILTLGKILSELRRFLLGAGYVGIEKVARYFEKTFSGEL